VGLGFPYSIPSSALGLDRPAPSQRITMAFIGLGDRSGSLIQSFTANPACHALAVCDVNRKFRDDAKKTINNFYGNRACTAYRDFRHVLDRKDIDAVAIATPDHWHAVQTIMACRAGKDVYCEKPLSLTVREARMMVDAGRRFGRVVQTGSQSRSYPNIRTICEAVRNGAIGPIREVHATCGGPSQPCDLPARPLPEHIDWDLWLGPAPWRPFHSKLADKEFRPYFDYSGGGMTDWGCHLFDLGQWGMGMDGSGPVEIVPPDGKEYEALTYRYADGATMMHHSGHPRAGVHFIGTEGRVSGRAVSNRWQVEPKELFEIPDGPTSTDQGSKCHTDNFLQCVCTRRRPHADVEIGCSTVTVCHLGNIAYWLRRPIKWNPVTEKIEGDDEATRMLDRAKREPWNV
jgi:predicted dehydrogenase